MFCCQQAIYSYQASQLLSAFNYISSSSKYARTVCCVSRHCIGVCVRACLDFILHLPQWFAFEIPCYSFVGYTQLYTGQEMFFSVLPFLVSVFLLFFLNI